MVTDRGAVAAAALLEVSVTIAPPVGAGAPRVTVPVDGDPPMTAVGPNATEDTHDFTVRAAVLLAPAAVAVMVAVAFVVTAVVVIVKVVLVAPAATVTEAGTTAAALLLARATTLPPAGAAADNVMVPVLGFPPITEVGFSVRVARSVLTVNTAVCVAPE